MFGWVMNTSLGANLFSNTNITISSLALFLNFRKKAGNFHILLKFLIHLDAKNKTHFTSNLTPISMSLFPEPRNKKKWLKTCKNQTVYRNKTYIYIIRCLGKSQGSAVKLKAGLFFILWFAVTSKSKIISSWAPKEPK